MKKKNIIFVLIIITLLVIGGVFWWKTGKERKEEDKWHVQWSRKNDYFVEETSKGKIIKNKRVGFSFLVPEGWKIKESEEGLDETRYGISLLSPDVEFDNNYFLVKGCVIGIEAFYDLAEFGNTNGIIMDLTRKETQERRDGHVIVYEELIKVGDRPALKITWKPDNPKGLEKLGELVEIKIPFENKGIVHIGTQFLPEYREKCSQEFDKFLKTALFQ